MTKKLPNILFIMTDQQRYDTFNFNNSNYKTPHLDHLINDSIFFKNAYCTNPSCVPSRAAIMTGKYPSECGAPSYITPLPADETTYMKRLQDAGYYTAVVGKQHFAGSKIEKGFNEANIIDCHFATQENSNAQPYVDFLAEHGVKPDDLMSYDLISGGTWQVATSLHLDDYIGELGKTWLKERASTLEKQPWSFTLSFPGPHHPYDLEGSKYSDLYNLDEIDLPKTSYADLDQKPDHFKEMGGYAKIYLKDFTKEQFLKTKRSYMANMSLIDEKIGEVIQLLKDQDLYDETLIIYTTDHGDFMGDYGMVEKLQCLTDSLMHIPLFVKPPIKGFKGTIVDDLVSNIDIAATCLTIANAEVPKELSNYAYNHYWDSEIAPTKRDHLYMEARDLRGILKDGIKVVYYIDRDYGEVYDMNIDPLEINNLWHHPDYQQAKQEAYALLLNRMYKATPEHNTPWNYGTPTI